MRSSRMRDESIKDLHMGKSEVGTRGVIGVRRARGKSISIEKGKFPSLPLRGRGRRVMTSWMLTKRIQSRLTNESKIAKPRVSKLEWRM